MMSSSVILILLCTILNTSTSLKPFKVHQTSQIFNMDPLELEEQLRSIQDENMTNSEDDSEKPYTLEVYVQDFFRCFVIGLNYYKSN